MNTIAVGARSNLFYLTYLKLGPLDSQHVNVFKQYAKQGHKMSGKSGGLMVSSARGTLFQIRHPLVGSGALLAGGGSLLALLCLLLFLLQQISFINHVYHRRHKLGPSAAGVIHLGFNITITWGACKICQILNPTQCE